MKDLKVIQKEPIHIYAYESEYSRKFYALGVWCFAYEMFARTNIVVNFEGFKAYNLLPSEEKIKMRAFILPIMLEHSIDLVRIIMFYENYFKGCLLQKGYLVHDLNPDNCPPVNNKNEPIVADNFFSAIFFNDYSKDDKSKQWTKATTLQISRLLNRKFQRLIDIPKEITKILSRLNKERNRLHFFNSVELTLGQPTIDDFFKIISYAEKEIKPKIMALNEELNGPSQKVG